MITTKWLVFQELARTGKTHRWVVLARQDGTKLGEVRWFGRWRQYGFFPEPGTVFASSCLTDLADFVRQAMAARRAA